MVDCIVDLTTSSLLMLGIKKKKPLVSIHFADFDARVISL